MHPDEPVHCLKLADFGWARLGLRAGDYVSPAGTPGFRAPEMFRRECRNALQADLYGAAISLWLMCFQQTPWKQAVNEDPWFEAFSATPTSRRDFWRWLANLGVGAEQQAFFNTALHTSPSARPPCIAALRAKVAQLGLGTTPHAELLADMLQRWPAVLEGRAEARSRAGRE